MNIKTEKVNTNTAPGAVGPYSQAVKHGNLVFCSGQIGINPENGELAQGIVDQANRVIQNLEAVLIASESGLNKVLQTTIYIADMGDYGKVNEIYARYFKNEPLPARATVEVSKLPKDALIEISCIASI